ncbi:AMP-binding protein [Desulfotomaculum copahuensis]|uniref:AMP-dependent synthetase/ligase domain-containing protein n=1 Tax=Desulfotomaculum copahuensis TaxID=1838280 RepID=A0A1B7LHF2_9FIRM|nr:AMP-binding protein [Desulfotomaculum copahuensis]OAT85602.1 hypothetical protein A6M21_05665 [Desulfotomaculum copahuensis]
MRGNAKAAAQLRKTAAVRVCVSLEENRPGGEDVSYREIMSVQAGVLAPVEAELEDPWLILYTGGTTGFPKGAVLSRRMITWNAVNTAVSWHLTHADVAPIFTPFFW